MRVVVFAVASLLTAGLVGEGVAQTANVGCIAGTRISGAQNLSTLLTGKTACFKPAGAADWTWQEFHQANGALIDWKRGANHPTDPTKQVGTWSAGNGNQAAVRYSYTGGASYTFIVCDLGGGSYAFQGVNGASTVSGATLKAGQSACP